MRAKRAFRPSADGLEPRVVLDHGLAGARAALVARASKPPTVRRTVAAKINVEFDKFQRDFNANRDAFRSSLQSIDPGAEAATAALRSEADALATEAAASRAASNAAIQPVLDSQSAADTRLLESRQARIAADARQAEADAAPGDIALRRAAQDADALADAAELAVVRADALLATARANADRLATEATADEAAARVADDRAKASAASDTDTRARNARATGLNEQSVAAFREYLSNRVNALAQGVSGAFLRLVAAPKSKGDDSHSEVPPSFIPGYVRVRLTDPRVIAAGDTESRPNVSLFNELRATIRVPGPNPTPASLDNAAQAAAIASARSAILNGVSLLKFARNGGSSKK